MTAVTGSWVLDLLLLVASFLFLFYRYLTSSRSYFKSRGIPHLEQRWFFQRKEDIFCKATTNQAHFLYNCFPGERYFGYFQNGEPTLLIKDPDLIHRVTVKDFAHFQDQGFKHLLGYLITENIFALKGNTWRSLRAKLIPTFTSGKIKLMFDQINKSGDRLINTVLEARDEPVDTKKTSTGYVMEVIASTAFGLDFSKDVETKEFLSKSSTVYVTGYHMMFIQFLMAISPKLVRFLGLSMFKREVEDYFLNLTKATKEYRRKNKIERDDYFQMLMTLQEAEESGKSLAMDGWNSEVDSLVSQLNDVPQTPKDKNTKLLTDKCITAQIFGFLWGGSDTVATTLMWALYHIAKDPAVQAKVVQEAESCLSQHGGWTYEAVKDMVYIDMVLQETMRLYAPAPLSLRECTIPYRIPGTETVLDKGVVVAIPVSGLHLDPEIYPDPKVFNPERFVENSHKPSATYRPFGDGPRICIAMRFAIVEMKLCLAKVLTRFSISVDQKTQEPFVFDPYFFPPNPLGGIWLNFHEKNKTVK